MKKRWIIVILLVSLILIGGCKSKKEEAADFTKELNFSSIFLKDSEALKIILFDKGDKNVALSRLREVNSVYESVCPKYNTKINEIREACVINKGVNDIQIKILENPNEDICKNNKESILKHTCYMFLALVTKKVDLCNLANQSKNYCYTSFALRYQDQKICDFIEDSGQKQACYLKSAIKRGKLEINSIILKEKYLSDSMNVIVTNTGDVKLTPCFGITVKNQNDNLICNIDCTLSLEGFNKNYLGDLNVGETKSTNNLIFVDGCKLDIAGEYKIKIDLLDEGKRILDTKETTFVI